MGQKRLRKTYLISWNKYIVNFQFIKKISEVKKWNLMNGSKQKVCKGGNRMLETEDLILDKAKFSDWRGMYRNVWSHNESTKYMTWTVTTNEDDAIIRIQKTIEFQKVHDTYLVYEKASGEPIGFAGVEELTPFVFQETGICLGPNYVRKGFGKQIVQCLIAYCKEKYGAKEFIYSTRDENEASNRLAKTMNFTFFSSEEKIDHRDGHRYFLQKYRLNL